MTDDDIPALAAAMTRTVRETISARGLCGLAAREATAWLPPAQGCRESPLPPLWGAWLRRCVDGEDVDAGEPWRAGE